MMRAASQTTFAMYKEFELATNLLSQRSNSMEEITNEESRSSGRLSTDSEGSDDTNVASDDDGETKVAIEDFSKHLVSPLKPTSGQQDGADQMLLHEATLRGRKLLREAVALYRLEVMTVS
eukprot:GHVN01097066.1.p2 GENE.GHVN01097066.1~~GHVN01097066.1.p2  ORF type:complete len:121 (-),score=28.86 GHVN01097066.1:1780-2142(-)